MMRWHIAANCSVSGCRRQEMHDRQLLWAVYVVSLAAMRTTSADSDVWNQQHAECDHWDTCTSAPGRAGIGTRSRQAWYEVDTLPGPQPVEVPERWCDVLVARWTVYQSGGSVKYRLESTELRHRKPRKCRVAVVEAWHKSDTTSDWKTKSATERLMLRCEAVVAVVNKRSDLASRKRDAKDWS